MKLRTLDEHFELKGQITDLSDMETGVACPECGKELHANFAIVLASLPPKYDAWCTECGWKGYV